MCRSEFSDYLRRNVIAPMMASLLILLTVAPDQADATGCCGGGGEKRPGISTGGIIAIGVAAAIAASAASANKPPPRPVRAQPPQRPPRTTKTVKPCEFPWVRSPRGTCVCAEGWQLTGHHCVKTQPKQEPASEFDVAKVQNCLNKLGYNVGAPTGKVGPATLAAFDQFQKENELGGRPKGPQDPVSRDKLLKLCAGPQQPTLATNAPIVKSVSTDTCLPRDLFDLLTSTYGARPGVKACDTECLPTPDSLSQGQIGDFEGRGVRWCRSCVRLSSFLPLLDILKLEKATDISICASPPRRVEYCAATATTIVKRYTKVQTIYKNLPQTVSNQGNIAVIVSAHNYANGIPLNENADNDAGAIFTLLTEQLGYSENNIIDLRNASLADMEKAFGNAADFKGELWNRVKTRQDAKVFIYLTGWGLTRQDDNASFFLPVDAQPGREAETAYPMQQLYDNLRQAGAQSTLLLLEADFGRDLSDFVMPPNMAEMAVRVMPEKPVPGLLVLTASDRDQRTLEDPEYNIGLFTRYLIEGLSGSADETPLGNADRNIDMVELYVYIANKVRLAATKCFGVMQKPLMGQVDNVLVGRLQGQ